MSAWTAADVPDQSGRTILVTGASSGLGLRTAEALAARGAAVLLGCRSMPRGERARAQVAEVATGPAPALVRLDLTDLGSVRTSAVTLTSSLRHLDVLVNNAGIMAPPLARTAEGFESQFATNHLGHFALTGLLLPALLRAPAPRVVTVSSVMHRMGRARWDDPNFEESRYRPWAAYGSSKLANLQFTFELARRAAATKLVAVAAHPGLAATNLVPARTEAATGTTAPAGEGRREASRPSLSTRVTHLFAQSDAQGALPQLYAATMPDVGPGDFWGPDGPFGARGGPTRTGAARAACDEAAARRLWELSEELTGVTYAGLTAPPARPAPGASRTRPRPSPT